MSVFGVFTIVGIVLVCYDYYKNKEEQINDWPNFEKCKDIFEIHRELIRFYFPLADDNLKD